jgi:hypothetical protein
LEIIILCVGALKEAHGDAMAIVHRELRQVTRAYLQDVISEAARLKRPGSETAALNKFLALVLP